MSNRMMRQDRLEDSETQPMRAFAPPRAPSTQPAMQPAMRPAGAPTFEPSYIPTGVAFLDGLLALADDKTGGKAGLLQRVVSYLIIGGFAAVVNLIMLQIGLLLPLAADKNLHWLIAFLIAAEISILANFIPNDRYTFSRLPGHARSWWQRLLRFHSTTIVGTTITFVVSYALYHWVGMLALLAEAIAIIIALMFNFTFHHLWTYRHIAETH